MMKRFLLTLGFLIFSACLALADSVAIKHFVVKNNPFATDEIAVVATDTVNNIMENVNGDFEFTVNGFQELLHFEKGTAFYRHKLDKSAFLYVKHEDDRGSISSLYYVYKGDRELSPVHISWIILLAIPIILVVIAYMFRKLIIVAAIILVIFIYFNYHHGLGFTTFFESIIDGMKGLFGH